MNIKNAFKSLSRVELILWLFSVAVITISFALSTAADYLTLTASLIGVTALIFVAKGHALGQLLTVVFAVFYGIISFYFRYYGEMITYLGMTSPIAVLAMLSWLKHPYKKTAEVTVRQMTKKQVLIMLGLTVAITVAFYFVLKALGTANLFFSTISVATSFLAVYLTFMRSSFYAVGYMANDFVLIILWAMATAQDTRYLPMIVCFTMFLINDLYGFINWQAMKKRQAACQVA